MSVVVIDTLARGGLGTAAFAITKDADVQAAYTVVADLPARDALPTWRRLPYMRVYVVSNGNDYRLGSDVTIPGQVWTLVTSLNSYQLLSEKNQPNGYVGLQANGKINPSFIENIYANASYVTANITTRNALTTLTGDIIITTDDSKIWVKLNNNPPVNVNGDFAELLFPGNVLSVNGMTGAVSITIANLLLFGSGTTDFNNQVAIAPAVTNLNSITGTHTINITTLFGNVANVQTYAKTHIGLADLNLLAANPTGAEIGYSLVWNGTEYVLSNISGGGGGLTNPMTTAGDLIIGTTGGAATRLGIGANTYVLTSNGTTANWQPSSGGGATTFSNGLTEATGAVKLGGTVIENTTLPIVNLQATAQDKKFIISNEYYYGIGIWTNNKSTFTASREALTLNQRTRVLADLGDDPIESNATILLQNGNFEISSIGQEQLTYAHETGGATYYGSLSAATINYRIPNGSSLYHTFRINTSGLNFYTSGSISPSGTSDFSITPTEVAVNKEFNLKSIDIGTYTPVSTLSFPLATNEANGKPVYWGGSSWLTVGGSAGNGLTDGTGGIINAGGYTYADISFIGYPINFEIGNGSYPFTRITLSAADVDVLGSFKLKGASFDAIFAQANTSTQTYTLPDATGTVALTSDIDTAIFQGTNSFTGGFSITANSGANPITFSTSGSGNSGDITLQTGASNKIILSGNTEISTLKITSSGTGGGGSALNLAAGTVTTPINGDFWINTSGAFARVNGVTVDLGAIGGGYATIQEDGTPLTARTKLNFIGTGITAQDNGGSTRTDVSLNATLEALAAYNQDGIVVQTAANTFVARDVVGTTNKITVTNGDGVAGNPTITIGADVVDRTISNTYTAGATQIFTHNGTNAGFRLAEAAGDPSVNVNGNLWLNSTTDDIFARIDGLSVGLTRTVIEDVSTTTYTFVEADRNKIKRFTHASGCTATIPAGLSTGWSTTVYRASGAGVLTVASGGTLESAGTTLNTEKTMAYVFHRGSNIHIVAGAVGSSGSYTNLNQFVDQTNWRTFYSNGNGDVTELAFGAYGTALKSNSTTSAPAFDYLNPVITRSFTANNYTVQNIDNGCVVELDNGATAGTVTLPTGLPLSWTCTIINRGTGILTLTTSGTTLTSDGTTLEIRYTGTTIYSRGSNAFTAIGAFGPRLTLANITGLLPVASGGTNVSSYAIGDLLQATGATILSKLASVSAGSFLRSGGVTTASAWSTVKLPDTMSALGLWVANSANTTVNLTATANQSIRVNAGGTAWEAYTPGGGGITNGAAANELMKSNGTNAVASGAFVTTAGDLTLGTSLTGALRTLTADGSATDVGFRFVAKGSGVFETPAITSLGYSTLAGDRTLQAASSSTDSTIAIIPKGIGFVQLVASEVQFGNNSFAGTTRTLKAVGSGSDVNLNNYAKGAGTWNAFAQSHGFYNLAGNKLIAFDPTSTANEIGFNWEGGRLYMKPAVSNTLANNHILIEAGSAATGTNAGGNVSILSGAPTGGGAEGFVAIQTRATGKLGFFNATPVIKPVAVTTAQGIADALRDLGLLTSSTISSGAGDMILATAQTSTAKKTFSVTGAIAGLNIGANATDPNTTLAAGDMYYQTSVGIRVYSGSAWSTVGSGGSGWAVTGTTTLTGAVDIITSATNTNKFRADALGATQSNGAGLWLANNTVAAAGAQQWSPSLVLEGQGWKTNATAASQSVKFALYTLPTEGSGSPSGNLYITYSVNNTAYTNAAYITSSGNIRLNPDGVQMDLTTGLSGGIQLGASGAAATGTLQGFANYHTNAPVTFRTTDVTGSSLSESITIRTGTTVNGNSGHLFISAGLPSGSGVQGNVAFSTTAVANWQGMADGLYVGNAVVAPTGNPTNGGFLYAAPTAADDSALTYRTPAGRVANLSSLGTPLALAMGYGM